MEDDDSNANMDGNESNFFDNSNMDSSNENVDHQVLRDGENNVNAEWSATTSALYLSDTSTSNSNICIQTLKECCANPSETLKDKEDFTVVDSTFTTATNLTYLNADDTKFSSVKKTMKFQLKHKLNSRNYSQAFENIIDDDSQLEETQNSLYLNHFQKHKILLTPNSEDFADNFNINKSNDSEMDSEEERMKPSKLCFSKKNKNLSYSKILDFDFSATKISTIADDVNISKVNSVFKNPSELSLVNYSSTVGTDTSKELNLKFTRQIVDYVVSAFDNVVNDSSMASNTIVNNKETSSSNLLVSPADRPSWCSTIEVDLNQTNDKPPNCNSTKIGSLSHSLKNNSEVTKNSINITYNVENYLTSTKSTDNVSLGSVNTKCTLSDTYTIENNEHETLTQQKSASNTVNTLTDISNTISQSKLPIRVCNSIRKRQLDKVLQDKIKIQDNYTTANSEMHGTDSNKSNRFKKKKFNGADSNIMLSQGNEVLSENTNVSNNIFSNTLNISTYNLSNISSKSNKNIKDLTNTSSTQPSNLILHAANENDLSISVIPTLPNTYNNSFHYKPKFNFGKQFGRQSLSYHKKSNNLTLKNLQNTSLNSSLLKIPKDVTNCFNKVSNKIDDDSDLCSLSSKIQEHYPNFKEVLQPLSDSLPFVSNALSNEVEKANHPLNSTFNLSQPSNLHFHSLIRSTHSPETSETKANTVNENMKDESIFWTDITENSQRKNTIVTRLSSISKTLTKYRSIVSENNVNQVSVHSLGTLETVASAVSENMNDYHILSSYHIALYSENFINTSATDNVIENENQTPRNKNKPTLVENIFNTIGKMSVHKRKSTHPEAFELDDCNLLVSEHSLNHRPSFLTRMIAENNNLKSTILSQSDSESLIELARVKETVNRKFKSLYNTESWITKRLYKFLVSKLLLEYNIYSVKNAEKFVKYLASILKQIYQKREDLQLYSDMLRFQMARYQIIHDTADYIQFLTDFIPRPYYDLLVPGWNLGTSPVKFEPTRYYLPIMDDEELLQKVSAYLDGAINII